MEAALERRLQYGSTQQIAGNGPDVIYTLTAFRRTAKFLRPVSCKRIPRGRIPFTREYGLIVPPKTALSASRLSISFSCAETIQRGYRVLTTLKWPSPSIKPATHWLKLKTLVVAGKLCRPLLTFLCRQSNVSTFTEMNT